MGGVDTRNRAVQGRKNPYGINPSEGSWAIRKGRMWGQEAWRKGFATVNVKEEAMYIIY